MSHPSELSPTTRFSERADDYAKYRPTYPQAAIDWILQGIGMPHTLRVADIGAGTGISSWLFAERRAQVAAVDPNPQMLAKAKRHTRIRFVAATAERTGLPARSFDLITCFQAFHWFKPELVMVEFRRILKARGRLAAAWNNRDYEDPFTLEYSHLVESLGEEAIAVERGRGMGPVVQTFEQGGFKNVERSEFRHFHRMDEAGFIGYARSASYLPRQGPDYERMRAGLQAIYARHADPGGYVVFPYRTTVVRGDHLRK
ncbi:MAG: class I SAM-dependent methyltransferase [Candidatus Baltobacteraceae bacterium]